MEFGLATLGIILFVFAIAGVLLLFFAFRLFKGIFKMFTMLAMNSIVGAIALVLLYILGVKIPLTIPVLASIAIFGLGGLGTLLLLMAFGINLG